MEELVSCFTNYGLVTTGIAILGIVILGCLKYFNLFNGMEESQRHYCYIAISIGITMVGTAIYQFCAGNFESDSFLALASLVYAMNQTFYNIFKVTPINNLASNLLTKLLTALGIKENTDESDDIDENER